MVDKVNIGTQHFYLSDDWLKNCTKRKKTNFDWLTVRNRDGAKIQKNHTVLRGMGIAAKLHSSYWTSDMQSDVGTSLLGKIVGQHSPLLEWIRYKVSLMKTKFAHYPKDKLVVLYCTSKWMRMFIHNLWFLSENESTLRWRSNKKVWKWISACHKSSSVQLKKRTREKAVLVPAKAMCLTFPFLTGETFRKLLMVSIWWERRKKYYWSPICNHSPHFSNA